MTHLKHLKDEQTEAQKIYYLARVVNSYRKIVQWNDKIAEKRGEIQQYKAKIRQCQGTLLLLKQEELRKQIKEIGNKQMFLTEIEKQVKDGENIKKQYVDWERNVCERYGSIEGFNEQWSGIKQVERWMEKYDTLEEIEVSFNRDCSNREARKKLKELESLLRKNEVWESFLSSFWAQDAESGALKTEQQLEELEKEMEYQQSIMRLSDINDTCSLSAWALENAWEMTPEEESLLVHFSSLKTVMPEKGKPI